MEATDHRSPLTSAPKVTSYDEKDQESIGHLRDIVAGSRCLPPGDDDDDMDLDVVYVGAVDQPQVTDLTYAGVEVTAPISIMTDSADTGAGSSLPVVTYPTDIAVETTVASVPLLHSSEPILCAVDQTLKPLDVSSTKQFANMIGSETVLFTASVPQKVDGRSRAARQRRVSNPHKEVAKARGNELDDHLKTEIARSLLICKDGAELFCTVSTLMNTAHSQGSTKTFSRLMDYMNHAGLYKHPATSPTYGVLCPKERRIFQSRLISITQDNYSDFQQLKLAAIFPTDRDRVSFALSMILRPS
jgi:hypothetical protein